MIRLTDEQWERIRKHFPEEHIPDGRAGRKPIPTRHVLEAVLWILNTGAQWHMLPQSYPNYKTVHRRFQTWCCHEILRLVLTDVANELRENGALDEEECFIDATFVMAKGGGSEIGPTKRGKGMKIMAIVDRHGLPLSVSTHAANHHEVRLVQLCFDFYMIEAKPENLIGDRAYDSDPLDEELRNDGIEMIAPHRSNRSKPPTQDRRRLSRYKRRWLVRALLRLDTSGNVAYSSAGSTTLRTSSALSSSHASLSSSDDFEIGSSLVVLAAGLQALQTMIRSIERRIIAQHRSDEASKRLRSIPGIGIVGATAIAATVPDPKVFRSGRDFAAWIGIVPREDSTGGKQKLGPISKQGDQYLRRILVVGAHAVLKRARHQPEKYPWVTRLLERFIF